MAKSNALERMGYIEAGVAKIKGKACVNVNTAEESPILVEAVFRGLLAPLNPMEIAGLLTAFIFQERRVEADFEGLPKNLLKAVEKLKVKPYKLEDVRVAEEGGTQPGHTIIARWKIGG